jgi:monofunctional biosynthetic peptidoglycan transglycosylase
MRTTAQRQKRANVAAGAVCGCSSSTDTYPLFSYVPRTTKRKRAPRPSKTRKKSWNWKCILGWTLGAVLALYGLLGVAIFLSRWIDPPTTAVQIERHIDASLHGKPYRKRYSFIPLSRISPHLQHAVMAAEDARFFHHHGFDWKEIGNAVEQDPGDRPKRGASTITQQLARNLFLSTGRSVVRKGLEFSIVPLMEGILPKQRILELYLNVIEWGPGVYGVEAASQYYFHIPASRIGREQAVALAEVLPAPLHRKPGHLTQYGARILERMRQMGF